MTTEKQYMFEGAPGAIVKIAGVEYSYFGGTSYYELHKNDQVLNAAAEAQKKYGITTSSSRSNFGTNQLLLDLEKEASDFFGTEDSVYLPSGFLTDMAALNIFTKENRFDAIFIDEFSHYSNHYAATLSRKPVYKFSHLNFEELEKKITFTSHKKPLVISDGVFPLNGKIAPAANYKKIVERIDGLLWIDDAHGIGVIGKNGRGTYEHFDLNSENIYYGGTFSKAFGGFGGIIPGKKEFITAIKNGELLNGATPAPSSAIAASLTGIKVFKSNSELREKLFSNTKHLKTSLSKIGIIVDNSPIPIVAFTLNDKANMLRIKNKLMSNNILIQYLNYIGSHSEGTLRIVVFSTHTFEQIDNLIFHLNKII